MQDKLKTMIQLCEPPFNVDVISTLDAMDGVLAIDEETTPRKTAKLMRQAGVKKRSDGKWNLASVRVWQTQAEDGRRSGRAAVYPFTGMEPGDSASFIDEGFQGRAYRAAMVYGHRTGKRFSGKLYVNEHGNQGITIERVDDGTPAVKKNHDTDAVQALIDWKAGVFVHDIVTATEAVKTLESIIDDISPVKVGLMLHQIPGAKRIRAYTGKKQVWLWVIRNLREYEKFGGREIWRIYRNERNQQG